MRDAIGTNGKTDFEGYGDLSLTELLPAILTRYCETEVLIAAPSIPDQAAEIIGKWMKKQRARMDGNGYLNYVAHMTIVADLSPEQSPMPSQWFAENPFKDRLTLVDYAQPDTALLLPDFAVTGPVNLRYGRHFTATATAVQDEIDALWKRFSVMGKDGDAKTAEEVEPDEKDIANATATETAADKTEPAKPEEEKKDKKRMMFRR